MPGEALDEGQKMVSGRERRHDARELVTYLAARQAHHIGNRITRSLTAKQQTYVSFDQINFVNLHGRERRDVVGQRELRRFAGTLVLNPKGKFGGRPLQGLPR
jgi:hypothetical protein